MRKLINDNTSEVLRILLKSLKVKFSKNTIKELENHPYFPDLISINQTLNKLKIENIAIKTTYDKICNELPTPLIVHIEDNGGMYLVVKEANDSKITFHVENNKIETQSKESFLKTWNGIALLVERNLNSKEKNYKNNVIKNFISKITSFLSYGVLIAIILLLIFHKKTHFNLFSYSFLISSAIGIFTSVMLIISMIDKNNPFLRKICSSKTNKKMDCSSILESEGAYFLGLFSWSEIGFVYFITQFVFLLLFPSVNSTLLISYFSTITFGYIFYSIYYQWKVAQTWCRLCLFIQLILFSQFIISIVLLNNNNTTKIDIQDVLFYLLIFLTNTILLSYILPLIKNNKVNEVQLKKTNKLKTDNEVFNLILKRNLYFNFNEFSSFITYGNKKAENIITCIINPTCKPCIKEQNLLIEILNRNSNISINLITLIDTENDNKSLNITKKIIEVYQKTEIDDFTNIISDYFNNYSNNHKDWIKKYWKGEMKNEIATEIIIKNNDWCFKNGITSTPIIIYDGYLLPKEYTLNDLEYLLK